jgi:hypothetical protein
MGRPPGRVVKLELTNEKRKSNIPSVDGVLGGLLLTLAGVGAGAGAAWWASTSAVRNGIERQAAALRDTLGRVETQLAEARDLHAKTIDAASDLLVRADQKRARAETAERRQRAKDGAADAPKYTDVQSYKRALERGQPRDPATERAFGWLQ